MDQSLQFPLLCRYYSLIFCTPTRWVIVPLPMYYMNSCQKIRDCPSILKNIPYTLAVSSFRLRLLNCFKLLFVYSWSQGSIFILLQTQIQFWQHYLLNSCLLRAAYFCQDCQNLGGSTYFSLFPCLLFYSVDLTTCFSSFTITWQNMVIKYFINSWKGKHLLWDNLSKG